MKSLKFIGIFILFLNLTASAQNNGSKTNSTQLDDWKILTESNFSISYPDNWDLNDSGQMGTAFVLFSPLASQEDQFKENINLVIQDLTGYNLDLDKYVEISKSEVKAMITEGDIIESKRIGSEDTSHHKIVFTGKQGIFKLKFEQYYWVINETAFILTFTCEEDQFESYHETGEKILTSFKILMN